MNPSDFEAIVQRLVQNPHDQEALAYAHHAGTADPGSYALVLERVGNETTDPAFASYWLCEAANIWANTLGDAHRAVHVLMAAIERDPAQNAAADRLAQLYREKGQLKDLAALLEHRTRTLAPMAPQAPELTPLLAAMHEEIGRLYSDLSMAQPRKAAEHFRRASELDPSNTLAIFSAREVYKSLGHYDDVWPLYAAELTVEADPARRVALLRDEAATRKAAGDLAGASAAIAGAREIDAQDPALQQEYATSIVERISAGESVPDRERTAAADLLVNLAEMYDGEHGLAYASGALDLGPAHERAMQLYVYYARTLQQEGDLAARFHAYLTTSPDGAMADEAAEYLAATYEQAGQHADAAAIRALRSAPAQAHRASSAHMRVAVPATPEIPPAAVSLSDIEPDVDSERGPAPEAPAAAPMQPRAQAASADRVQAILDDAQSLAAAGKKPEACARYREVLESDASHPEALSWVEDFLRTTRDYAALRDVLMASVRAVAGNRDSQETRKQRLREIAGLCEGNLRDIDGAIGALKQLLAIDRADEASRQSLGRILDKAQRWDDLANLLEQEATSAGDIDTKIALEKKLATLQEQKRSDFGAAAEAWARIAQLIPEDDRAVSTAAGLFEKAGLLGQAAQVIADSASGVEDPVARAQLFERLGDLREQAGDAPAAGAAFADAAAIAAKPKLWESAERCFISAGQWDRAGEAAAALADLSGDPNIEAEHSARASGYFLKGGLESKGLERLERATQLDPHKEAYSATLCEQYESLAKWESLVAHLTKRGAHVSEAPARVALRKRAAIASASRLDDKAGARQLWLSVLEDGDDREALEALIDLAAERADHIEATTLLRRLADIAEGNSDKAAVALREAALLADPLGEIDNAIARYEWVLSDLDAKNRTALQALAALHEGREQFQEAAAALERELVISSRPEDRATIGRHLAQLYDRTGNPALAIVALDTVRQADAEDFEALARLCDLCEQQELWSRTAELMAERVEIEGDEEEASKLTLKLAGILADRLGRGDEALACMTELADRGDEAMRGAYVALGDKLGWKGIVAGKLVEWWFGAKSSEERSAALRTAFNRFAEVGRVEEASKLAVELIRVRAADGALAAQLEQMTVASGDHDALFLAQDALLRDTSGHDRATELVRQSEVRAQAGLPRAEAVAHGEQGLASVAPSEANALLDRLAAIAEHPSEVIDLFERQVSRAKQPADRVRALARAAQIASSQSAAERAQSFYELALGGLPTDDVLTMLEMSAVEGDEATGNEHLRRALCAAFAAGGGGARDGGRTRGALLRRAAKIACEQLRDLDQAFTWMGDALVACVEPATLDALQAMSEEIGDVSRAEAAISRALAEVFDGPLVRQLLSRRARIRRDQLGDHAGAAADLKKLHDLSPSDQSVMEELSALLTELGDYRGMVQLYEDQILRGKEVSTRAELARKVAQLWEERLQDAREAADAWRRVLRMKPGDADAAAGLERAKSNMLRKPEIAAVEALQAVEPSPAEEVGDSERVAHDSVSPTVPPPPPLDDTSDNRAATTPVVPAAAAERRRDSDMPTMATSRDDIEALLAEAGPLRTPSIELGATPVPPAPSRDVMLNTDERPAVDFSEEAIIDAQPQDDDDGDDVIIVDDFADVVDVEDDDSDFAPPAPPHRD